MCYKRVFLQCKFDSMQKDKILNPESVIIINDTISLISQNQHKQSFSKHKMRPVSKKHNFDNKNHKHNFDNKNHKNNFDNKNHKQRFNASATRNSRFQHIFNIDDSEKQKQEKNKGCQKQVKQIERIYLDQQDQMARQFVMIEIDKQLGDHQMQQKPYPKQQQINNQIQIIVQESQQMQMEQQHNCQNINENLQGQNAQDKIVHDAISHEQNCEESEIDVVQLLIKKGKMVKIVRETEKDGEFVVLHTFQGMSGQLVRTKQEIMKNRISILLNYYEQILEIIDVPNSTVASSSSSEHFGSSNASHEPQNQSNESSSQSNESSSQQNESSSQSKEPFSPCDS